MTNTIKVLVVEDEDDDVYMAKHVLQTDKLYASMGSIIHDKEGINLDTYVVHDGEEAQDYLLGEGRYKEGLHPRPDVVLLDLRLRRTDGFEILRWIKESPELRDVHVVILTGSEGQADMDRAFELGAESYIVKPLTTEGFIKVAGKIGILNRGKK
jgi:two-component system, response regulator